MVLPWDRLKWSENPGPEKRMSMVNLVKYMGGIYIYIYKISVDEVELLDDFSEKVC